MPARSRAMLLAALCAVLAASQAGASREGALIGLYADTRGDACTGTTSVGSPLAIYVLALLEPVIRFVCILALLSGIIAASVFELSAVGPSVPILGMLSASLGFGFALIAYYGLFSLVSR